MGNKSKKILNYIKSTKYFSILRDETLDVSGKEQFSLYIRYVSDDVRPELRKDFITFIQIKELSAEYIFNEILKTCKNLVHNIDNLEGQGYDGVSTFSGHITGVHKRIQELYRKAVYVHCASHRLNLVLSDSLSVPSIRNCLGVVNEISNWSRTNSQASDL